MVARQDDRRNAGPPHLGNEKLKHGVGDARIVKDIAGNQQRIGGQRADPVHHGGQSARGGIGIPVVAQVSVGSVYQTDFAAGSHFVLHQYAGWTG